MEEYNPRDHEQSTEQPSAETQSSGEAADLLTEMADQTEMSFVAETGGGKRGTAIVVFTLLLIGAGAIGFMRFKSSPKSAKASTPQATSANETIKTFLNDGGKNMKMMQDLLQSTSKLRQRFLNYQARAQIKLEELRTNPFRLEKEKQDDPNADLIAAQEKARKEREKLVADTKAAAGQLKIQSIMAGNVRTCMINNKMCQEGQEIEGFKIVKIKPDGVVVTKSGLTLTVRMSR